MVESVRPTDMSDSLIRYVSVYRGTSPTLVAHSTLLSWLCSATLSSTGL